MRNRHFGTLVTIIIFIVLLVFAVSFYQFPVVFAVLFYQFPVMR